MVSVRMGARASGDEEDSGNLVIEAPVTTRAELVAAQSGSEIDRAFEFIFSLVETARDDGDLAPCDLLLTWVVSPDILPAVHIDVLLSCVRLTYTMREEIVSWKDALTAVSAELARRGEDVETLLCGLTV